MLCLEIQTELFITLVNIICINYQTRRFVLLLTSYFLESISGQFVMHRKFRTFTLLIHLFVPFVRKIATLNNI